MARLMARLMAFLKAGETVVLMAGLRGCLMVVQWVVQWALHRSDTYACTMKNQWQDSCKAQYSLLQMPTPRSTENRPKTAARS
jgi:hypothetical protein